MGDELPGPGNSTRQRTFSFSLHLRGRFLSEDTPVPSGPRQPGQLPAAAESIVEAERMGARQIAIEFFTVVVS